MGVAILLLLLLLILVQRGKEAPAPGGAWTADPSDLRITAT